MANEEILTRNQSEVIYLTHFLGKYEVRNAYNNHNKQPRRTNKVPLLNEGRSTVVV